MQQVSTQIVSVARCAEYPDNNLFKEERASIERAWPAFAADTSLSRPPAWVYNDVQPRSILARDDPIAEGKVWKAQYEKRLQRTLPRMNYHSHSLSNREDDVETGDRRHLSSCTASKTKGMPKLFSASRRDDRSTQKPLVARCQTNTIR